MELVTVVVGTKFRKGPAALAAVARMQPGGEVALIRDPANEYDANAIECHFLGTMVGFIPRQANPAIAKAMDAGRTVTAVVTEPGRIQAGKLRTEPKLIVRWSE